MAQSNTVNIAILDTDVPVPAVRSVRGLYSDIFTNLLQEALQRINQTSFPPTDFSFTTRGYDCTKGEYPSDLDQVDAVLITGSAASSYDDTPWIRTLDTWVYKTFTRYPNIRWFGSCFGHQLICQSLLRERGIAVERDVKGWELGVHPIELTADFLSAFPTKLEELPALRANNLTASPSGQPLVKAQFVHADHVVSIDGNAAFPLGWVLVGSTAHCHVQGVLLPNRVLTLQGHFEFDRFVNSETVKVFGAKWPASVREVVLKDIDKDDDAELLAEIVATFFISGRTTSRGGLLTPPSEM